MRLFIFLLACSKGATPDTAAPTEDTGNQDTGSDDTGVHDTGEATDRLCENLVWGQASITTAEDWSAFCDAGYNALQDSEPAFLYWDAEDGDAPDCLCEVDGDVSLRSPAGLSGLRRLRSAGWLSFLGEEQAIVFPALESAQRLSGTGLSVSAPKLTQVEELSFTGDAVELPLLQEVDDLLLILRADLSLPELLSLGSARIEAGPLVSVPRLELAEELYLSPGKNWSLGDSSVYTFPALTRVDALSLVVSELQAPSLQEVAQLAPCGTGELPVLTRVETLHVQPGCGEVQLPGVRELVHLSAQVGSHNGAFLGFGGLTALERTERLSVSSVSFSLDDLPEVVVSDTLSIQSQNLSGTLSPTLLGGSLQVQDAKNTELSYLNSVSEIPGSLSLVDTYTSTLAEWDALRSVGGDITLSGNPYLNDAQIQRWVADIRVGGELVVSE